MTMFLYLLTAVLGIFVLSWIYRFSRQDSDKRASAVFKLLFNLKILQFLHKFRLLLRFMEPHTEIIYSDEGLPLPLTTEFIAGANNAKERFQLRSNDVFVVTYPKAGTTWMQEITWLMCNNANTAKAKEEPLALRVPFLEFIEIPIVSGLETIIATPPTKQRIIKTHLPYDFLPNEVKKGGECKIIYVARNPKDVCVSYYHFCLSNSGLPDPGNWRTHLENFTAGKLCYGDWFQHNLTFWKLFQEKDERVYFVTYEDMKKDLLKELHGIAKFLDKDLTEEQLEAIAKHCTFDSMSKNDATNHSDFSSICMDFEISKFMRKGKIGDWKNYFTLNQNAAFDSVYKEKMKDSTLQMIFE